MDFGIANVATMKDDKMVETAWAIKEVANAMQAAQDKQTKKVMAMFKEILTSLTMGNIPAKPTEQL